MPVDVHVARIARLVRLTERKDASWRTVEDITASLRHVDPTDPVRFDFAIAHLGISGGCTGTYVADTCQPCPLSTVCRAPQGLPANR
jgi:endonuclease III